MARAGISIGGAMLAVAFGGFVAAGGARAAEPVRPAGEATRPCPKSGKGFVHIPGSTTCIRLSGRVAAGVDMGSARRAAPANPPNLARLSIDTRSDTEYGPVRTFVRMGTGHR